MSVYFLTTECRRFMKIGMSREPSKRIADIQRMCPIRLDILKLLPGGKRTEESFHEIFEYTRLHGEWFAVDEVELAWVSQLDESAACEEDLRAADQLKAIGVGA